MGRIGAPAFKNDDVKKAYKELGVAIKSNNYKAIKDAQAKLNAAIEKAGA